ncbi:hypothetical protein D1007_38461 [Hordeum vulgare]|nr:hypothetical protein D1007_38461 [Hordeum vulgare]
MVIQCCSLASRPSQSSPDSIAFTDSFLMAIKQLFEHRIHVIGGSSPRYNSCCFQASLPSPAKCKLFNMCSFWKKSVVFLRTRQPLCTSNFIFVLFKAIVHINTRVFPSEQQKCASTVCCINEMQLSRSLQRL